MKTTHFLTFLLLTFTLCAARQARAVGDSILLDADLRGTVSWESVTGPGFDAQQWMHGDYSSTGSYFTSASSYFDESSGEFFFWESRNFFRFDLIALSSATWVTGATLQLEHSGTSSSLTYGIGPIGVDPLNSPPDYPGDIGGAKTFFFSIYGDAYGSASIVGASSGDVLSIELTAFALADINAALLAGNLIAFGGSVTAGGNVSMFSGTAGLSTQLAIATTPNSQPVADVASLTILSGEGATLDGSGSSDTDSIYGDIIESYAWDLDGNGTFDFDSSSATLALTAAELDNFGISAPGSYDITLQVEDSWGVSGTVVQSLTVTQVPEPSTLLLGVLAGVGLLARRRNRK
ncbi:MAG: PEP-CTERM sorting domain-containing protein [Planctomycetes bacterium]|nr:PEP-CTERM sorting domain-containing protein [Planctomycetota bacterium]